MIEIKSANEFEKICDKNSNIVHSEENLIEISDESIKDEKLLKFITEDFSGLSMDERGLLSLYIRDVCKYPLLTPEEEKEVVKRIKEGDEAAKTLFINSNLRLVVSVARKYAYAGLAILDVIQEGNLGLMRAIETFDLDKGVKFSTYAYWWIKQSISRAVSDKSRTIRLPVHFYEKMYKAKRAMAQIEGTPSDEPKEKRIAEITGYTEEEVVKLLNYFEETISLNTPTSNENDGEYMEFIDSGEDVFKEIEKADLKKELNSIIDRKLTEKEADVIRKRFGIFSNHSMTLDEIGTEYGVTRERIRQIEEKAIRKLRNPMIKYKLQDYLIS